MQGVHCTCRVHYKEVPLHLLIQNGMWTISICNTYPYSPVVPWATDANHPFLWQMTKAVLTSIGPQMGPVERVATTPAGDVVSMVTSTYPRSVVGSMPRFLTE